jgi:hypothetical protein
MAGGIIGTLSIVVYGQILRRPPIPIKRIASLSAVAAAGGVIGGTIVRANAHADFFRNLDNRPAFFRAIDNIQTRLGEKPYPGSDHQNQEMADSAISSRGSWEETTDNRAAVAPNPSWVTHPAHLYKRSSFCRPYTVFSSQESLGRDPNGTCAQHGGRVCLG